MFSSTMKKNRIQRIIVDIDNTLWDFASVFQEKLKEIAPDIPPMTEWEWDFYMDYISIEELYSIVNDIHIEQDLFKPFKSSKWFLESLINKGYEITIASHRQEISREATEMFLKKNNLPYTELHLSSNKAVLFDSSIAIVDDAPHLLDEAKKNGLICTGLLHPWNKHTEHPLFKSLEEIFDYLKRMLDSYRK